jgi:hypothetical protein
VILCLDCDQVLFEIPDHLDEPWKRYVERLLNVLRKATPAELTKAEHDSMIPRELREGSLEVDVPPSVGMTKEKPK